MLTINELFSGIGSQSAALKRLGIDFKVVGIAEIDKYAIKSYEAIHGQVRNYGDISKIVKLDYADFWTYSFPCQDLSVAGKGKGMIHICNDCGYEWEIEFSEKPICPNCYSKNVITSRSGLLKEVERLLEKSVNENESPKWLMLENVKNLIGKANKGLFDIWLKKLDELGYNTYWQVLNAKHYGVPQNRERAFAISIRKDIDKGYIFPKGFDLSIRLKDVLENEVDEKFYISNDRLNILLKNIDINRVNENSLIGSSQKNTAIKNDGISTSLTSAMGMGGGQTPMVIQIGNVHPSGNGMNGNVFSQEGVCPTLTTNKGEGPKVLQIGNIVDTGNFDNPQRGRIYSMDGCSPALNCVGGGGLEPKILEPYIVASKGRNPNNPNDRTLGAPTEQRLEINKNGTSNTITTVQKDNYVIEPSGIYTGDSKEFHSGPLDGISRCLKASKHDASVIFTNFRIRKLTPRECWRLMGFSDLDFFSAMLLDKDAAIKLLIKYKDNTNGIEIMAEAEILQKTSNSQLYKQAGNSIVVDVLYYLFENLFVNKPSIDDLVKHAKLENQLTIDDWLGGLT